MLAFAKPISDVDDDPRLVFEWVMVEVEESWANQQQDCGLILCVLPDDTVIAKP